MRSTLHLRSLSYQFSDLCLLARCCAVFVVIFLATGLRAEEPDQDLPDVTAQKSRPARAVLALPGSAVPQIINQRQGVGTPTSLEAGELTTVIEQRPAPIISVGLTHDGKVGACAIKSQNGDLIVRDLDTMQNLQSMSGGSPSVVTMSFAEPRLIWASGYSYGMSFSGDEWQNPVRHLQLNSRGWLCLANTWDGKFLVAGSKSGVHFWKLTWTLPRERLDPFATWPTQNLAVTSVAISPDGKMIVASLGNSWTSDGKPHESLDDSLHLYDVASQQQNAVKGHVGGTWQMAMSPDGKKLYTAGHDHRIGVWNFPAMKRSRDLMGHTQAVTALALSHDGRTLVSGDETGAIRLWEPREGKTVRQIKEHEGAVRSLAISADGKKFTSGGEDGRWLLHKLPESKSPTADSSLVGKQLEGTEPVPSTDSQAKAQDLVKDIFQTELSAAKTPEAKLALATTFVQQADKTTDAAERYVLLEQARDLAVAAGDANEAINVVEHLGAYFAMNRWPMMLDVVERALRSMPPTAPRKPLAERLLVLADDASARDQYEIAKKLLVIGLAAAKKSQDPGLVRQITERGRELVILDREQGTIRKATETLQATPDDPDANLLLGKHLCYVKHNWQQGLPHLVKSGDEKLSEAAKQELAGLATANDRVALADRWWELAQAASGNEKVALVGHAESWYQAAAPELNGLMQAKVQNRLTEIAALSSTAEPPEEKEKPTRPSAPAKAVPLMQQVKQAIKKKKVERTNCYGNANANNQSIKQFEEVPELGLLLVGFNYSMNQNEAVAQLQPVYAAAKDVMPGAVYGRNQRSPMVSIVAKKGYAVGGLKAYGGNHGGVYGFEIIFMKIGKQSLDVKDSYNSPLIGSQQFTGNETRTIGGDGRPVIGVYGSTYIDWSVQGIGLIQPGSP